MILVQLVAIIGIQISPYIQFERVRIAVMGATAETRAFVKIFDAVSTQVHELKGLVNEVRTNVDNLLVLFKKGEEKK